MEQEIDARVRRVLIECGCGYLDETTASPQHDPDVLGGAKELIAEHRKARGCRREFRLQAVLADSDLGRMDISRALAPIDVADLLGEEI